ncbi:MAG: acyl-CoA dehydrogenase family protein [Candidatus Lokiarchaeota archaeon]|nr:acyl-CoA dehydrogenase family protein [Candidatus Harpocratesius repetitus]
MPIKLSDAVYTNLLEKNFDKALSLRNRYSFINANIFPLLSKEEQELLLEFEENCIKLQKDVNRDDVYTIAPKLGEKRMLQRMNPYDGIEGSSKHQMLLNIAVNGMAPEVDFAMTASSILVGNSLFHNPKRTDVQQKALEEIWDGTAIGGIGITEMQNGSDAVNMKTQATIHDDKSFTYNGIKIYTTNGAVADYYSTYGVTDISNPRRTMMLGLFKRGDEGLKAERLRIPAAPGIGIAKVTYDNVTVPADRMIAEPGEGYRRLFRGLTPERIAITSGSLAGEWHTLATGAIFSQIRYQFGKPLLKYQGISHVLSDLYAHIAAYTAFAFQVADFYDKKVGKKIHQGEKPNPMDEGTVAILAAQAKYLAAKYSLHAAYEVVQTMGGRGAINEPGSQNMINRGENVARLMEVLGGHRNIQLMIIEAGLKATTMMSIDRFVKKARKNEEKTNAKVIELYIQRAEKMLTEDAEFLSENTKNQLNEALTRLKTAIETKHKVDLKAYSSALPKILNSAGKEAYQARKAQKS